MEKIMRLPHQPRTHHEPGGEIDQVPVVDPVVPPHVELVEFRLAGLARPLLPILVGHQPHGPGPCLMDVAFHQPLDLGRRHVDEFPGQVEHQPHAHADEAVALAILALAELEVAMDLFELLVRLQTVQPGDETLCGERAHAPNIRPVPSTHCPSPAGAIFSTNSPAATSTPCASAPSHRRGARLPAKPAPASRKCTSLPF